MNDKELQSQAIEVMELIEDCVEFYCREQQVSGEKVWTMIATLSACKLSEFPNSRFFDDN